MTAIKTKLEQNIIDLSRKKVSKSSLQKTLKGTKLRSLVRKEDGISITLFITTIKVGIYDIHLNIYDFTGYQFDKDLKLPKARPFDIAITESNQDYPIDLNADSVFKNQPWVQVNNEKNLNVDSLIESIMHCKRVSQMKTFL